jgi:hypothetical protein
MAELTMEVLKKGFELLNNPPKQELCFFLTQWELDAHKELGLLPTDARFGEIHRCARLVKIGL